MIAFVTAHFAIILGLVTVLLWRVCRHNILLLGRCVKSEGPQMEYRFVIQNCEDVALRTSLQISIKIVGNSDGVFFPEVELMCGVKRMGMKAELSSTSEYVINCSEIPPLDTWVIVCKTNLAADELRLTMEAAKHGEMNWYQKIMAFGTRRLSVHKNEQVTQKEAASARGPSQVPTPFVGFATIGLAVVLYLVPVFNPDVWFAAYFTRFDPLLDCIILAGLMTGSACSYLLCRRKVPPVIQGYLEWRG